MLEHETDVILQALLARTIGARDSLLFREILSADIPRGIKTYLQADIVRSLEAELFASPRFARVVRTAPGVRRQSRAFVSSMAATYSISRPEFLPLIENAVHFLENYLCRPQWTIEHFVFESADRVPVADVIAKLDCTVEYAYFRTLIPRVMERRGLREIGAEELRDIIGKIDDQIVRQHNARELALLAKPIFDFLLLRDTPPDVSIPLKPILVFFDDKKMKILRDYIESISRIRQKEEITLDELTTLVEDLYLGAGEPEKPPAAPVAAPPVAAPPAAEPPEPVPAPETAAEAPPETGATMPPETGAEAPPETGTAMPPETGTAMPPETDTGPLTVTVLASAEELAEPGAESQPPGEEEAPPEAALRTTPEEPMTDRRVFEPTIEIRTPANFDFMTEEPDGREEFSPAEEPRRLPDIRQIIDAHQRSRFVRKLFDRDEAKYEDTITSLNNASTWKEAATHLNALYISSGLDPFDADVVQFTDAIQRRYQDAERDGE